MNLIFENEYQIYFDLSNSDSDLSISFIQNIGDRASYVINFYDSGKVDLQNVDDVRL